MKKPHKLTVSENITFHGVILQGQSGCLFFYLATVDCDRKLEETDWYQDK